jgi:hypothetical protein
MRVRRNGDEREMKEGGMERVRRRRVNERKMDGRQ